MIKYFSLVFLVTHAQSFHSSIHPSTYTGNKIPTSSLYSTTQPSKSRAPWDVFRFLKQSSRFVSVPLNKKSSSKIKPGDTLWEAGSKSNTFTFGPLDDVVMGGASSSNFDEATGLWKGTVTTANNGGFIGIRSTPFSSTLDLSECKGVEFEIIAPTKGQNIKGMLRDNSEFNGATWCTTFNVSKSGGSVMKVRLPFDKLIATKFARIIDGMTFQKSNVAGVQLVYSKFEYDGKLNPTFSVGDFSLQLVSVKAY